MEYIILDLEWDSIFYKPEKRFVNQILQIGAVKLDRKLNVIDTFSETICSEITNKVSGRFAKLTGITSEKMRAGISFVEAVEKYNNFCKNANVTMTWSNSDLYTIIENQDLFLKDGPKFFFKGYLDLQKLVQGKLRENGYENKNQISLEGAAELLGIDTDNFDLHTALDDCRACALMLKACYEKQKFESMIKDATSPDFYDRLRFKSYSISDINDSNINRNELKFTCPKCGNKTERMRPFKYRNRWFVADFKCTVCDFKFNGRVAFKKTYDDLQVKHKVCEYKPRKKKNNDMQSVPKTVSVVENRE